MWLASFDQCFHSPQLNDYFGKKKHVTEIFWLLRDERVFSRSRLIWEHAETSSLISNFKMHESTCDGGALFFSKTDFLPETNLCLKNNCG